MKKMRLTLRFLLAAGALTFCLSACGGSGTSTSSAASSTSKAASWTNINIRALDEMININWDKAAGSALGASVPTYNIYCSTDPANLVQDKNRIATNYEGNSFDYSGLDNGNRYYCAVTQVTATGEGPPSLTVSAAPQAVLPAAPFGLKVTALFSNTSSVKLEFTGPTPPNPANVTYKLYRSTTRDFTTDSTENLGTAFPAPYIDKKSKLTNGTTYYYAVKTVVANKESGFSPVVSARPQDKVDAKDSNPPDLDAFGSPSNISAEPGNGSCIIRWMAADSPINIDPPLISTPDYILYWSNLPDVLNDSNKVQLDNIAKNLTADTNGVFTYTLSGLNNGTTYYLQLVAAMKDTNGITYQGTPGPVVSVTPALKTPAVPSGLSATQGSQQVSLTWSKDTSGIPNVTYNIYFSTTNANTPAELMAKTVKVIPSTKAYYTHSGLDSGMTYYYVVTSVGNGDGEGESAPSKIISVTL